MCIWNARWTCVSMFCWKMVGLLHYSWDQQVQNSAKKKPLKLGPTWSYSHLKIILRQYFQSSIINGIQNKPKCLNFVLEISQNTCSLFKYKSSCRFNLVYYPHLFLKKQKKIIIYYNLCNLWHKLNSLGRLLYFYFVINNHAI